MLVTLVKLMLLMVSYFGWWEFFRGRRGINVYFAPILTIGVQFTLLFLPGILNFLPEAVAVIYLAGFVMLADALHREKLGFVKHYRNPGYVLLALVMALLLVVLRGKQVTWMDNFTHWATVVKNMLAADRFPTFAQKAVSFTTYPLGSSAMIYYFSRLTNEAESFWMLAQVFLMLCALLPLFAYGEKGPIAAIFLALAGNFLLCYNVPLTELLVDTLLPLAGGACLLFLHRYYLQQQEKLPMGYAFALLFWVMNIKSAGLLFVAAGVILLALAQKKQGESWKPVVSLLLALLAGYLIWDRHCDYVFDNSAIRQHEISLRYFKQILGGKSLSDAYTIALLTVKAMVLRRELAWLLGAMLLLGGLTWAFAPEQKKTYGRLLAFLAIAFLVYAISMVGMYLFSMSLEGALELQSADRYYRIWEAFAWYLLAAYAVALFSACPGRRWAGVLLTAAMGCCMVFNYGSSRWFFRFPQYYDGERVQNEAPIAEYGVEPGKGYLICAEDDRAWTAAFLWGYCLDSNQICQIHVTQASQLDVARQYDYVVILDEDNPVIEDWVAENHPEQAGKTVIQCFR